MKTRLAATVLAAAVISVVIAVGPAHAAAPALVNPTRFLESLTIPNENGPGNTLRMTFLVKHDPGVSVSNLRVDDDYDGTDNTSTAATRTITTQEIAGTNYTRISTTFTPSSANVGFTCNQTSASVRRTSKTVRARVTLSDGTFVTTDDDVNMVTDTNCVAPIASAEDSPFIYGQSQNVQSVDAGGSVTFTFRGDDSDTDFLGSDCDTFDGMRWRARRLNDGALTAVTTRNDFTGDNGTWSFPVTFNQRGRWVVEAEAACEPNHDYTIGSGKWFYIGAVDVNSSATGPNDSISIPTVRINQQVTATASVDDSNDASDGGIPQILDWDADGNSVFERRELGEPATPTGAPDLDTAQKQQTIDTTGMVPHSTHTVRIRTTDNGAMNAADDARKQKTTSQTFTIANTAPASTARSFTTEATSPVAFTLTRTDAD